MYIIIRGTHALRSLPVASFVWEQVVTGAEPARMCVVVREGVMCIGVTLTETGVILAGVS